MRPIKFARRGLAVVGVSVVLALAGRPAAGEQLIGNDYNGVLYDVDLGTGALSNPRSTGLPNLAGITYALDGTLYGLSIDAGTPAFCRLYVIDPITGKATYKSMPDENVSEGDLAIDPTSGTFYGVQESVSNGLYLFKLTNFIAGRIGSPVAGIPGSDLSAMAFDRSGLLYIVDTGQSRLLTINKTTAAPTSNVGLSLTGLGPVAGMAIDYITGIAYLATGTALAGSNVPGGTGTGTNSLYTVNLATGALTLVGPLTGGSAGLAGLAFPPVPPPLLHISKTHVGDFEQGLNAQYFLTVANDGTGPSFGTITVTDSLPPAGLTLVSMSGTGWSCVSNACTRNDILPADASFPPITVTVNVAANAPAQVTNQATVSGGSSASVSTSNATNIVSACFYSFPSSPVSAGSGSSSGSATLVTSPSNCAHQSVVSNNPDWVTVTSGQSGAGSSTIGYTIAANNNGGPRTGSFTVLLASGVAVATFAINQAAAACSSLTLSPAQFTFSPAGGSGTVNFNTSPCAWSITGNPSWINLQSSSGTSASFSFTVQPNPPPASTRQATLNINGGALSVTITQTGLVCTYFITDSAFRSSRSFPSSGGSDVIEVFAPVGCPWTASPSQSFITINGNASGNGNGAVNFSVAANSSSTNFQGGAVTIAGFAYVISEQPTNPQTNSCSVTSLGSSVRPEGFTEKVADVVFVCTAPPGSLTGDIRVSFNAGAASASITNLHLRSGQTDVLLLEDEPTASNLILGTNAYRGFVSHSNGSSSILFPGVQLASSNGGQLLHTWRITNARINAQALSAGTTVQATVSITAPAPFSMNSQPTVATVSAASPFSVSSSFTVTGQTIQPLSFTEGFATAFQPRLAAGQDPSQAGTVYNAESGYLNTAKLGTQTGFAANGTRLMAAIANVPAAVSVWVPVAPASGTNAVLVSADNTGAGGFPLAGTIVFNGIGYRQLNLTAGVGTATWEVTASDPSSLETLTFNILLVNPGGVSVTGITYAGALGPLSAGPAPQLPSTSLPVPRFSSSAITVAQPSTVTLSVLPQAVVTQGQSQGNALKPSLRSAAVTPSNSATGGIVSWIQVQANTGATGASAAPNVSVSGTLPATWLITGCSALDSAGVCPALNPNNPSNSYTVTYPSLSPGQTGTIMLTAQSDSQTSGAVEYTSSINSDLSNSDSGGTLTTNFPVSQIGLNVSLTHASNFSQGQDGAQYSVTVSNGGNLPTSVPVTVTEMLPAGLTLVSMAGNGWFCTGATASCTRSDVLAANSSFPSITVSVNVASNAASTVTNQVTVSTGLLQATGSDPTNITGGTGTTPTFFNGQVSLGNGVYYLQFSNGIPFGYFNSSTFPILYHYDLGFVAFVDGGNGAAYLYDFSSNHWLYTNSSLFPYLFDFNLNNWLYYFPDTKNPGHYTTNPRSFANLGTGKIITF